MIVRHLADLHFHQLPGRRSADPFASAETEGTSVRVVRIDPGTARSPHRHPRSCEIVHVVEGAGTAWHDGRAQQVRVGDTILVPQGVPHATFPDPDSSLLLVCFFPDPDLATNLEEAPGRIQQGPPGGGS